jgi:hypothetical protein
MNEAEEKKLLAIVQSVARKLGADVAADKDAKEQYARGLAFIFGRLLGKPPLVRAVAGWALEYLPEAEPIAAPAGDTDPHAALMERRKKWGGLDGVRLHVPKGDA